MKKILLSILLAAAMLVPATASADQRGGHRQQNKTENSRSGNSNRSGSNSHRGSGANKPGNGRPGGNKNDNKNHNNKNDHNNKNNKNNHDKKGHDKNHGNDRWGGNSQGRPGGNSHNPGMNHRPGNTPRPGHGSSIGAPGHRPGPAYGKHHHPPRLGGMVKHCVRGARYDNVWMVAPGQYAVRFFRNGHYYMQYIWPDAGRYGTPFRIVMNGPGEWYAYNNRNQWYYDDGNSLRISLNGSPLSPWTLIPSVELNIDL